MKRGRQYKLYNATLLDIQFGLHRLQNKLKYRGNILVERFAQTVGLLQTVGSSLCQEWKHGCILGGSLEYPCTHP